MLSQVHSPVGWLILLIELQQFPIRPKYGHCLRQQAPCVRCKHLEGILYHRLLALFLSYSLSWRTIDWKFFVI